MGSGVCRNDLHHLHDPGSGVCQSPGREYDGHPFRKQLADTDELQCLFAQYYATLERHVEEAEPDDLLYLGQIQAELDGALYVDPIHYNDRMNKHLALLIGAKASEMASRPVP